MYEITLFLTAILIGFMGSGHCLGMCGGIVSAHSFGLQSRNKADNPDLIVSTAGTGTASAPSGSAASRLNALPSLLLFNCGRIGSYMLIGMLAGFLGSAIAIDKPMMLLMRSLAGVMLILMGLYLGQWWAGLVHIEKLGSRVWQHISPLSGRLQSDSTSLPQWAKSLLLGALWGWLPCGLVYSALAWSMTSADPAMAAILMGGFGLGTLPGMLAAGLFAFHLRRWLSRLSVRRVFAVAMILFGLWTLPLSAILGQKHDMSDVPHHGTPDMQSTH